MANIINPFQTNPTDNLYIFNQLAKPVKLNGNDTQAILTHSAVNKDYDDFKITSLAALQRGDVVEYDNKKYLVLSEINSDRHNKYKAIIRNMPFHLHVQTGTEKVFTGEYDRLNNPIFEDTPIYADLDFFIQNQPAITLNSSNAISFTEGEFYVFARDDEDSQKFTEGLTFELIGCTWEIEFIDLSKQGLRIFKLNKTSTPTS